MGAAGRRLGASLLTGSILSLKQRQSGAGCRGLRRKRRTVTQERERTRETRLGRIRDQGPAALGNQAPPSPLLGCFLGQTATHFGLILPRCPRPPAHLRLRTGQGASLVCPSPSAQCPEHSLAGREEWLKHLRSLLPQSLCGPGTGLSPLGPGGTWPWGTPSGPVYCWSITRTDETHGRDN